LINTHVDIYFLNLLAFDVLQSIGGIINAKWVADAAISPGPLCDSQGILKNAGALGGAMFILAITIHTAAALLWKWKVPKSFAIPLVITLAIWLFIALGIGVSWSLYRHRQYIDITGMWCWIGSDFKNQRLLFEYAWMWITVFFNLLVYIPLYFSLRGNLSVSGFHVKWTSLYPLAYTITVIPFSICRWRTFNGYSVPWAATVVADILFCSSGLVNSLLYPLTRPSLLPAG
ncbi:uncharacterized protein EI90DRAFT_2894971, partial [Cantharellus anzutake]|uniref:uncharacterized protein n=1 Tax=Cantharellus anzutake TaxID=1750568 RepID=UPI001908320A